MNFEKKILIRLSVMKIIPLCSLVVVSYIIYIFSCNKSKVFINFFLRLTILFIHNKYITYRTVWACEVRTNYLHK
jgi:hypothetical protein